MALVGPAAQLVGTMPTGVAMVALSAPGWEGQGVYPTAVRPHCLARNLFLYEPKASTFKILN